MKELQYSSVRGSLEPSERFPDLYACGTNGSSALKSSVSTDNCWLLSQPLRRGDEQEQQSNNSAGARGSTSPPVYCSRSIESDDEQSLPAVNGTLSKQGVLEESSEEDGTQVFDPKCISNRINGCKKRKLYQPQQHDISKAADEKRKTAAVPVNLADFGSFQERLTALQQLSRSQQEPPEAKRLNREGSSFERQSLPMNPNMLRPTLNHLTPINDYMDAAKRVLLEQQYARMKAAGDLETLAEMLKRELASSLAHLIDDTLSRFTAQQQQQHRNHPKAGEDVTTKQKARIIDRGLRNGDIISFNLPPQFRTPYFPPFLSNPPPPSCPNPSVTSSAMALNSLSPATNCPGRQPNNLSLDQDSDNVEQDEAISLVMSPKQSKAPANDESPSPIETIPSPSPNQNAATNNSPPLSRSSTPQSCYPHGATSQAQLLGNPSLLSAYFAAAAAAAAVSSARNPESNPLLHRAMLGAPSSAHFCPYDFGERSPDSLELAHCLDGYNQIFTLTPMHLRKAKLMFFWVRYPSSAILKAYFPDVKFNKNNTAQLVKWFSNFREFYYIQMEKYSRQLLNEGLTNADDIHVSVNSELFRVLNMHYNRNNQIEVPAQFVLVVTQTMREFFKAIQARKDCEPSWKKAIYKIIARLDEPVPDFFRSPNFLERFDG